LVVGLLILFRARYGWRKSLALGAVLLPGLLLLAAGRTTDLSAASAGTGQERIQVWSIGLDLLKSSPVFGIGKDQFAERVGDTHLVAHNSFIHCFAELGLFGGTLFLGMFYLGLVSLHQLGKAPEAEVDPGLRPLQPFLLAVLVAYATCLMSIS